MGFVKFLKNWTLPVAIAVGSFFYLLFASVPALDTAASVCGPVFDVLLPLTIFLTLFVTFSKVDFHLMRLRRWHAAVLAAQLLLALLLLLPTFHFALPTPHSALPTPHPILPTLLTSLLVCVLAPCASASPVVTAKLGGDLTQMTTFVLLSSFVTSLLIPAIFPLLPLPTPDSPLPTPHPALPTPDFLSILRRLSVVLLLPLALGAVVRHWVKPLYRWFLRTPDLGFYLWSVSLAITSGITVKNILHSQAGAPLLAAIALSSLLLALVQLWIGRRIGRRYGEHVCTGQGMFQKNTGLAIWIAYTFLTPVASIGAGCYVLWQNCINSYELWQYRRSAATAVCTAASSTRD